MIKGYERDKFGIIKNTNPVGFNYGEAYQKELVDRGERNMYMSYLRYGYLVGVIGRIPLTILDVGYGDGMFLKVCNENGYTKCYGSELSPELLPEGCEFVTDITEYNYDVICFFDSLEHFRDIDFIKDLKCNYVYVSIPNCVYLSDEWFRDWFHRKPEQHVWNFNKNSIATLFAYNGYKLIADSYIEHILRKSKQDILTMIFKKI